MAENQGKPKVTFDKISDWKNPDETQKKRIVLSRITGEGGRKSLFLNEQGEGKDGKPYSKKGVVIPPSQATAIGDALKIAGASEVSN